MSNSDEGKPKFLEFNIEPVETERPRSINEPRKTVNISGKIYTGGSKGPIDITIDHPGGKKEDIKTWPAGSGESGQQYIEKFNSPYTITVDTEIGKFDVKAIIRAQNCEPNDCEREGSFVVK